MYYYKLIKLHAVIVVLVDEYHCVVWCNCAGQKWWQDMQKADAVKSKPVATNTGAAVKPATVTQAAGAVKPGTVATTAAAAAAPAGHGAGRAATTSTAAAGAAGRTAAARAAPLPSRGDMAVKLILFIC